MRIQLSTEQSEFFTPIFAALDAKVRGYAEGVEAAKVEIVRALAAQQEPAGKPELVKETTAS